MAHVMDAGADRIVPWRRADWRIDVGEGLVLILAGVYLLADGQRAEFILGLTLYRVATADSIAGLVVATSWLVIGAGIVIGAVGVVHRALARAATSQSSGTSRPTDGQTDERAPA